MCMCVCVGKPHPRMHVCVCVCVEEFSKTDQLLPTSCLALSAVMMLWCVLAVRSTHPEGQLYSFGVEVEATSDLVVRVGRLLQLCCVFLWRGRGREKGGESTLLSLFLFFSFFLSLLSLSLN